MTSRYHSPLPLGCQVEVPIWADPPLIGEVVSRWSPGWLSPCPWMMKIRTTRGDFTFPMVDVAPRSLVVRFQSRARAMASSGTVLLDLLLLECVSLSLAALSRLLGPCSGLFLASIAQGVVIDSMARRGRWLWALKGTIQDLQELTSWDLDWVASMPVPAIHGPTGDRVLVTWSHQGLGEVRHFCLSQHDSREGSRMVIDLVRSSGLS